MKKALLLPKLPLHSPGRQGAHRKPEDPWKYMPERYAFSFFWGKIPWLSLILGRVCKPRNRSEYNLYSCTEGAISHPTTSATGVSFPLDHKTKNPKSQDVGTARNSED